MRSIETDRKELNTTTLNGKVLQFYTPPGAWEGSGGWLHHTLSRALAASNIRRRVAMAAVTTLPPGHKLVSSETAEGVSHMRAKRRKGRLGRNEITILERRDDESVEEIEHTAM